ncbi:entericidin A/B family lipoprotein [Thioclava sp. SK-1]
MSKLVAPAFALIAVLGLAACQTVEGFGRDVSTAGSTIAYEANDAR